MAVENAKLSPLTDAVGNASASGALLAVWRKHAGSAVGKKYFLDDLVTNEASLSPGAGHRLPPLLSVEASSLASRFVLLEPGTQRDAAYRFLFRRSSINPSINFKKHLS